MSAPTRLPDRASQHLDLIRGVAAISVVLVHFREIFPSGVTLASPGLLTRAFYFLSGFGIQAVTVFFVLSGFFISLGVFSAHASGRWSWRDYLIRRGARLYTVLIPALVLCALWDQSGMHLFGVKGTVYESLLHADDAGLPNVGMSRFGIVTFLGNAAFLQYIRVAAFGSDTALWSLSFEFWYYLAFPALVIALMPGHSWRRRLVHAAFVLALPWFCGSWITMSFTLWLSGACAGWLWSTGRIYSGRWALVLTWTGLALTLPGLAWSRLHQGMPQEFIAVPFAFFVWALLGWARSTKPQPDPVMHYGRLAAWVAGFSYSLYVVHHPVYHWLRSALMPASETWPVDPLHFAYWGLILIGVLTYAYVFSRLTEAHTETVRRWLNRIIPQGRER